MKKFLIAAMVMCLSLPGWAQSTTVNLKKNTTKTQKKEAPKKGITPDGENVKLYDENIDAMEQIDRALDQARESGRFVICQVGGNWCPWCLRFANFITDNKEIADLVEKHFVYIHVNYSKENKNEEAMKRLGNPGRFGYPVLVILDDEGRVMHIQNSSYLEEEKSYNLKKVMQFFQNWTREAIDNLK